MSEPKDIRLGAATIIALVSTTVGVGVTWGAYSSRLKAAESALEENRKIVQQQQVTLATVQAQYNEIIWRLDRIEGLAKQH